MLTELFLHPQPLSPSVKRASLGSRPVAIPIRRQVENMLDRGGDVVLDFHKVDATQSFIDELVGVLILQRGTPVLDHVSFRDCSTDIKGIIRFVIADRANQRAKATGLAH